MSASIGPDDLSIVVGSTQITGWQAVSVTRSVEAFPNSFSLVAADPFWTDPTRELMAAGAPCKIYIGTDLVITGYIDRVGTTIGPNRHDLTITGRGLCQDLVDCSADTLNTPDLKNSQVSAANALELARKLTKAFNITVRSAVTDLGPQVNNMTIANGE